MRPRHRGYRRIAVPLVATEGPGNASVEPASLAARADSQGTANVPVFRVVEPMIDAAKAARKREADLEARQAAAREGGQERQLQGVSSGSEVARGSTQDVICSVFGSRCREALAVARCESRYSTYAQNGQYLGLFQMGSWERRTYGHGASAYAQTAAAYRYFVASGSDWSPWSCKPW